MQSQPQNSEFRINPENFHPCIYTNLIYTKKIEGYLNSFYYITFEKIISKQVGHWLEMVYLPPGGIL